MQLISGRGINRVMMASRVCLDKHPEYTALPVGVSLLELPDVAMFVGITRQVIPHLCIRRPEVGK